MFSVTNKIRRRIRAANASTTGKASDSGSAATVSREPARAPRHRLVWGALAVGPANRHVGLVALAHPLDDFARFSRERHLADPHLEARAAGSAAAARVRAG